MMSIEAECDYTGLGFSFVVGMVIRTLSQPRFLFRQYSINIMFCIYIHASLCKLWVLEEGLWPLTSQMGIWIMVQIMKIRQKGLNLVLHVCILQMDFFLD